MRMENARHAITITLRTLRISKRRRNAVNVELNIMKCGFAEKCLFNILIALSAMIWDSNRKWTGSDLSSLYFHTFQR